jgi:predicted dehydrogenase/threonine dehydrogenase-like Zn-dependent dehydrogenase
VKQVLIRQGAATVEAVPAPQVEPGTVLVRVDHSCISIGTELSGLRSSGRSLLERARQQPQQLKRVAEMVAQHGLRQTRELVQGKLAAATPTGYSAAGVVVAVGDGIDDLRPGDRVACAGNQYAHHAELVRVPRNLVVPVPEGLDLPSASTVTLGAIALQGVRRASPTLGETFVVIGLGILGQLTAQLLSANGCQVIGTDLDRERIALARSLGAEHGIHPDDGVDVDQVLRLTGGVGADGVIITAATPSDAVISTAFRMCRRKGRVVLVGDVGLSLDRADFYQKELDFFISTSYGPGRYDERYEEHGLDYPVGYVRWTENRNLGEYLRLLATGRVRVQPLLAAVHDVDQAPEAYASLNGDARPLLVLLRFPRRDEAEVAAPRVPNPRAAGAPPTGKVRLTVVGAGGFARGMHLPNLKALADAYHLRGIVSRTGANAASTASQFGADWSATDFRQALEDEATDAVLIATRHDLHARMALEALEAGKHVLLEKPLALTHDEVERFRAFYAGGGQKPVLLTGFNRRFSPAAVRARELVAGRSNPLVASYRMNAGHIPLDHWVHGPEGGGRNLGEACHIYDLFGFLTGARAVRVSAQALAPATAHYGRDDNFVATVGYDDGSVCTLVYTALGPKELPKERMELFADGRALVLDDYVELAVVGARAAGVKLRAQDKGQKAELAAFARAVLQGGEWPIPLWEQLQTSEVALRVQAELDGDRGSAGR